MDLTMPFEKKMAWNLSVLQRRDPAVVRIMASASFVSVYEFHSERQTWKKLDCEGCLFLVRRGAAPQFQLIVVNKMCPDDHVTELGDIEVNDTYLMMSTPTGIEGFWFYDSQERELVTLQIQKALREMAGGTEVGGPPIPFAGALHVEEFEAATRPYVPPPQEYYDRGRFKMALIKLIQTDDEFVDKIFYEFQNVVDHEQ